LYFYNFIQWREQNLQIEQTDSLNNVLLGLPASKLSRQIFSRCWWMAEVTRELVKEYAKSPILNGDYAGQLLDVNMFKMQMFQLLSWGIYTFKKYESTVQAKIKNIYVLYLGN
jgi:hypothetical protein